MSLMECFNTWGYIISQQMRSFELVHEGDTLTVIYPIFKVCWLWVDWNASLCVRKLKDLSLEIGLLMLVQGTIQNSVEKPFSSSIVLLPLFVTAVLEGMIPTNTPGLGEWRGGRRVLCMHTITSAQTEGKARKLHWWGKECYSHFLSAPKKDFRFRVNPKALPRT